MIPLQKMAFLVKKSKNREILITASKRLSDFVPETLTNRPTPTLSPLRGGKGQK